MARIRSIKPEFFTSPDVTALPVAARLSWIGLWGYCDDHGRGLDDPRLIKAAVWPLDSDVDAEAVENHLAEFERRHMVQRYEVDGRRYIAVTNWSKHQRVYNPGREKYPPPPAPTLFDPDPPETLTRISGVSPEAQRNGSGDSHETLGSSRARAGSGNRDQVKPPTPLRGVGRSDVRHPSRSAVRSVPCPKCNASRDEPCRGPGFPRDANHRERVDAYEAFVALNGQGPPRIAGAEALGRNRARVLTEDELRAELETQYREPELVEAGLSSWRQARGEDGSEGDRREGRSA